MKTPLCEPCLQTRDLCSGCSLKLESGVLSSFEVDFSRTLHKLEEKLALEEVDLSHAFDCDNIAYVITRTPAGHLIGKGGRTVRTLRKEVGKHVRVIQFPCDRQRLAEEVLHPVKPLGFTTIFREGKNLLKVRVPKRGARDLPARLPLLNGVFSRLLGEQTIVVLE